MYYGDYKTIKAQRKTLQQAFEKGKLSEETYKLKIQELNSKINNYEMQELRKSGFGGAKVQNGHYVIDLECHCGYKGAMTFGKMDFKLLGKDRKGFIYFGCPECKRHLQYDPITGKTRTKRGILGRLFGRFG